MKASKLIEVLNKAITEKGDWEIHHFKMDDEESGEFSAEPLEGIAYDDDNKNFILVTSDELDAMDTTDMESV